MNQAEIFRARQAARRRELLHGQQGRRPHFHKWSSKRTFLAHKQFFRSEIAHGRLQKMYQMLRSKGLSTDLIRVITERVLDAEFDEKYYSKEFGSYGHVTY